MIRISLLWETCADGIEVVPANSLDRSEELFDEEEGALVARYRSARRKPVRFVLDSLNNPLVVQLGNARSLKHLEAFYGQYGLEMLPFHRAEERHASPISRPEEIRSRALISSLVAMGRGAPAARREHANLVLRDLPIRTQLIAAGKARSVGLFTNNLFNYMRWECIAVAEVGAQLIECPRCQKFFLVGPKTERRADAVYCSNGCRQAISRRRSAKRGV